MLSLVLLLVSESTTSSPQSSRGGLALAPASSPSSSSSKATTLPPGATRDPRTFMVGTPSPTVKFNCSAGKLALWPTTKMQWCCTYQNKGCPKVGATPPPGKAFDCQTREIWIPPKVLWCCTYKHAGCPPPSPPSSPTASAPATTTTTSKTIKITAPTQTPVPLSTEARSFDLGSNGQGGGGRGTPPLDVPPPASFPKYYNNITGAECATCKMFCLTGFKLGFDGCPACRCNPGDLVFDCTAPTPWFTQQRVWCCSQFNICTAAGPTPTPRPAEANQMCKMGAPAADGHGQCGPGLTCVTTPTQLPPGLEGYGKCVSSIPTPKGTSQPSSSSSSSSSSSQTRSLGNPGIPIGTGIIATTTHPSNTQQSTATTTQPSISSQTSGGVTTTKGPRSSGTATPPPPTTPTTTTTTTTTGPRPTTASRHTTTVSPPRTSASGSTTASTTPPPDSTVSAGSTSGALGEKCQYGWNTRIVNCADSLTCAVTNTINDPSGDPGKQSFQGVCQTTA